MFRIIRHVGLLVALVCALDAIATAAGPAGMASSGGALAPRPTATASSARPSSPRPVAVYVGRQLVASGQSLTQAVAKVRTLVPFTIEAPRYTPRGYIPAQLAVTPQQRDVSSGFSTLSYVVPGRDKSILVGNGFQIDQAAQAIPYVGGTRVISMTVGSADGTLHEFKAGGHDILVLTWTDGAGHGFDIVTDAALSHLSSATLRSIAASLR